MHAACPVLEPEPPPVTVILLIKPSHLLMKKSRARIDAPSTALRNSLSRTATLVKGCCILSTDPLPIALLERRMTVFFLPAQVDCTSSTTPLLYTSSPLDLLWSDIKLFFHHAYTLPGIMLPLGPWGSGELDELYPSPANLYSIFLHVTLILGQLLVLISIPLFLFSPIPLGLFVLYLTIFSSVNHAVCLLLNGRKLTLESRIKLDSSSFPHQHKDEQWIFVNGVAVGYDITLLTQKNFS